LFGEKAAQKRAKPSASLAQYVMEAAAFLPMREGLQQKIVRRGERKARPNEVEKPPACVRFFYFIGARPNY